MSRHIAVLTLIAACGAVAAPPNTDAPDREGAEFLSRLDPEILNKQTLGCVVLETEPSAFVMPRGAAGVVVPLLENGPNTNRIDIVFVGDGYTATQQASFVNHAQNGLDEMIVQEPFASYETFFNAYAVEVISNESGVSNDPDVGITRDTALGMTYWCGGTERLLCVNTGAAIAFAAAAPGTDQIIAVANSSKYGGAGYPSLDIGTYAGGNGSAREVFIHELGHSLGALADEYNYGGPEVHPAFEPGPLNVSILDGPGMASAGTKWANWLGEPDVGGVCGHYEGANYSRMGVYRPTATSKMQTLGPDFNKISIEGLILEFYGFVNPIEDSRPGNFLLASQELWIETIDPVTHEQTVSWYVDDALVPGATGKTFTPESVIAGYGPSEVRVEAIDMTPLVRNEAARQSRMRSVRTWDVYRTVFADISLDCRVDASDITIFLISFGDEDGGPTDLNGDEKTDASDLTLLLNAFGDECPE